MADDPRRGRARTVAEVIADDAPVAAGRARAIMAAVTRTTAALDPGRAPIRLTADQVHLHEDGSVSLDADTGALGAGGEGTGAEGARSEGTGAPGIGADSELGASLGRLLFALLVGRPPFDREEAFEPALRAALPASTCALIARSASEAPGQWPTVDDWADELTSVAGPLAPPLPAPERRRARRRRIILLAALALLAVVSVVVVWLAPRWWDAATDEESSGSEAPALSQVAPSQLERPDQLERDSS